MNNFFKTDNRYNTKSFCMPILTHNQQKKITTAAITTSVNMATKKQEILNQTIKSSFCDKINKILTHWHQLQQNKKKYQPPHPQQQLLQGKKQQKHEYDEFDRIMDEDLENQLKELERQEQEQYKLIEQVIEEQLEQEEQQGIVPNNLEENPLEHLMSIQELETLVKEEGEEQQQKNDMLANKNKTWKHHKQHFHLEQFNKYQQQQQSNKKQSGRNNELCQQIDRETWKQKHDIYLKNIMDKGHLMKLNRIIDLLKAFYRTKKYYVQQSKSYKHTRY